MALERAKGGLTTVLIAEAHAMVREGLRLLLETQADLRVVADVASARGAVQRVRDLQPDVGILALATPDTDGIEAARGIRAVSPRTRIIIVSGHATGERVRSAFSAGADGYVLKGAAGSELVDAVRTVAVGRRYLSQDAWNRLAEVYGIGAPPGTPAPLERLSSREREVLLLVVGGKSSATIGEILGLSPKTVDTYRSRLMDKLEIRNVPGLVRFAIQRGLISLY